MAKATIEIEVSYDGPPNEPPSSPRRVRDTIENTQTDKLSGTGDKSGAKTDKTVPDGAGGSDRTEQDQPVPEGATFKEATITMRLDCPPMMTLGPAKGNVSVSGRVDGDCIEITTVNREKVGAGTKVITQVRRMCCPKKRAEKPDTGQTAAIPVKGPRTALPVKGPRTALPVKKGPKTTRR